MGELLLNVIFPLYLLIALGYLFGKKWPFLETKTISTIVLYVFAPALIFESFRELRSLEDIALISAAALFVFFGVYLLSLAVEKLLLREKDGAFELSSTVMNAGYLGIPLIYLTFGKDALPVALTFMVVMAFYHFTIGVAILNRSWLLGLKEALKLPLVYALILSFLLKGVSLPQGFERMVKLTGDSTMPLMLVSIGISLSRIDLSKVKLGVLSSLIRFFGGTAVSLLAVKFLGIEGLTARVIVVQSSLPSAILNFVLCERFNRSPDVAASSIFVSTLLFPLYLPVLIYLIGLMDF